MGSPSDIELNDIVAVMGETDGRSIKADLTEGIEQRILNSSVIVLVHRQESAGKIKWVLSEVLKHAPEIAFYYEVGE